MILKCTRFGVFSPYRVLILCFGCNLNPECTQNGDFLCFDCPFSVASSVFAESEEATGNERQKRPYSLPVAHFLVKSEEATGNER